MTVSNFGYCALALLAVLAACGERAAERAVAKRFPAGSTKFQGVVRNGDAVCGEVNATGRSGTSGYRRFIQDDLMNDVTIAPDASYQPADLAAFAMTCRMAGGRAGAAALCAQADLARQAFEDGQRFEQNWLRRCVGK